MLMLKEPSFVPLGKIRNPLRPPYHNFLLSQLQLEITRPILDFDPGNERYGCYTFHFRGRNPKSVEIRRKVMELSQVEVGYKYSGMEGVTDFLPNTVSITGQRKNAGNVC